MKSTENQNSDIANSNINATSIHKNNKFASLINTDFSLLSLLNLAQEINTYTNISNIARVRTSIEVSLLDNFVKLFSMKYNITKERVMNVVNITARLENVDNSNSNTIAIQTIIKSQLQSILKKPSSIIFYNEPLTILNSIKYPFIFPIKTLNQYQSSSFINERKSNKVSSLLNSNLIPSSSNAKTNEILRKGTILNLKGIFSRLKDSDETSARKLEENRFFLKLKYGLRIEAVKWRLGIDFKSIVTVFYIIEVTFCL